MSQLEGLLATLLEHASGASCTANYIGAAADSIRERCGCSLATIDIQDESGSPICSSSMPPLHLQDPHMSPGPGISDAGRSLPFQGPRGIKGTIRLQWGDSTAPAWSSEGLRVAAAVIGEVVGRLEAEAETRRGSDTETAINALLRVAMAEISLEDLLQASLDVVLAIPWLHARAGGAIFIRESGGDKLVMLAHAGLGAEVVSRCAQVRVGNCVCGQVAQDGRAVFASADDPCEMIACRVTRQGHYYVPIASADEVLGVLSLCIPPGHRYRRSEEWSLMAISDTLSGIITRKRTEDVLRNERRILEDVTAHANCGLLLLDDQAAVTYANRVAEEWFGAMDLLVGKACFELLHGEGDPADSAARMALESGTTVRGSDFVMHVNGEERHLFTVASPVTGRDGVVHQVTVAIIDITERKRSERWLRSALKDLRRKNTEISALLRCARSVLDHGDFRRATAAIIQECKGLVGGSAGYFARTSDEGVTEEAFYVDPYGAPRDLTYPAGLHGLTRQVWETGHGAIRNHADGDTRDLALEGLLGVESLLCVPLVVDSRVAGLLGMVNKPGGFDEEDLRTATGFAEVAAVALRNSETLHLLEQSEELYRTLVEAIGDGVHVKDADLRYVFLNSEQIRRLGRTREEMIGKRLEELVGEERAANYTAADREVLATGKSIQVESEFPDPRLPIVCLTRKVPLRDRDGNVIGVITVSHDITERKRLQDQLLRAQRLETAGRIAGQVAHDFNNLLAPLALYPDLIKMSISAEHGAVRHLDAILEIVQQMAGINANLLALGRRGRIQQQPLDLNSILSQTLGQMIDLPATLRTNVRLEPGLWTLSGSPSQILRVISNLISNAREAMQDAGDLTLATENVRLNGHQGEFGWIPGGEYVRLTVRDTGCGILPEHRDRIFDAFFTTKVSARGGGSGLGLSIVLAVVNDHGGFVDLETEAGRGTCFQIYLPASRVESVQVDQKPLLHGNERVLVVDDEAAQREAVQQLLTRLGYDAHAVCSGEKAVEFLTEREVDLIVLDVQLPGGMNGVETFRQIRELRPDQKAVIMSGHVDTEIARNAKAIGIASYVHKPVTLEVLARSVREALDADAKLATP